MALPSVPRALQHLFFIVLRVPTTCIRVCVCVCVGRGRGRGGGRIIKHRSTLKELFQIALYYAMHDIESHRDTHLHLGHLALLLNMAALFCIQRVPGREGRGGEYMRKVRCLFKFHRCVMHHAVPCFHGWRKTTALQMKRATGVEL